MQLAQYRTGALHLAERQEADLRRRLSKCPPPRDKCKPDLPGQSGKKIGGVEFPHTDALSASDR